MNRSNPFDEIEQFFGRNPFAGDRMWGRDGRGTDVDVADYDDEFVVMADLPGYERSDIDVRAADGRLTIRAERDAVDERGDGRGATGDGSDAATDEMAASGHRYLRRERRHESVTRAIDLPAAVMEEDASATYHNGVLTVTLPKERHGEDDSGHRIDVE